ncbi:MAG: hypothetical protein MUF20_13620 [Methylotetracoccus sp.]|nr:hypothetical protein [Methylotetracoccus sp.]
MTDQGKPIEFPLGAEGPFHRLQVALRLIAEDRPHLMRRLIVALAVTWLPLALLWWWQGVSVSGSGRAASLFTHIVTYARFFVTLPLLIAAENAVRPSLEHAFAQAITAGMVPPSRYEQFVELLMRALRSRESKLAEALALGLAFLASQIAVSVATSEHHASWIHTGPALTWAGMWFTYVSLPLLQFMMFRWLYRLSIWWRVMYGLSRLDLSIQPGHPDLRGGLAFLGDSVQAFAILALAFGAAAAGSVADYVLSEGASITELKGFIAGAVLCILLLFLGPLAFFFGPAYRAKDEALLRYEGLAERHWQAFDKKWVGADASPRGPGQIAEPDFSALADLGSLVKTVREMKTLPLTKEGVLPLVVAIIMPFLPVLAMAFPLQELLAGVFHVFLGRAE